MKPKIVLIVICTFFLFTSISFGYKATFTPKLTVKGEYTDNVSLTENKDLKEDDIITTISPGFTAELVGKKGDAKISYDPSYAFYNDFDEFNGWRHRARFSGMYMTTKNTRLDVRDNFLYTEDPIRYDDLAKVRTEDPTLPIDTSERKTRRIYKSNYASVGLNHQFGEYHSFRLGYSYGLLSNDDPVYEDKQNHNASAGLTYWFGPKWGFDVNGSYTRGEFDVSDNVNEYRGNISFLKRFDKHLTGYIRYSHLVVKFDESGEDTTYIPTIGFNYDIEKDISLSADAGYYYTDSELRENTSNAIGDLRLIKRFERGQLNLAVLGGYDYNLYGAETNGYGQYYEVSISLSHQLAKHLNGNILGSYRDTKYKDQADREEKRPTVGLGLSWQALEWMNIGLNYRFRSVDSTRDTDDYDENRVSVNITVSPTVPFHTSRY